MNSAPAANKLCVSVDGIFFGHDFGTTEKGEEK
jgi:hypothetical protein